MIERISKKYSPWHAPQATVSCTGSVKAEILC